MPTSKLADHGAPPATVLDGRAPPAPPVHSAPARPSAAASAGSSSPGRGPRWTALDRLRAVSLLLMLFHHLTRWFSGGSRDVIPSLGGMTVTDIAAPAFAITAGASVVLFTRARRASGGGRRREVGTVLRRYGLLVPIGVALVWVVSGDPLEFGVLQMLGVTTVFAYAVGRIFGATGTAIAAAVGLALGPIAERMADGSLPEDSIAHNVLGDIFPLVLYTGFVCLGAAIAHGFQRPPSARQAAWAAATLGAPIMVLLVAGIRPQRYPGDTMFVLVSLLAAAGLYAALAAWNPSSRGRCDRVLRAAARHTFGVYIGHYAIFVVIDRLAVPDVALAPAMAMAVVGSIGIALLAPRVPALPFSLRGVRRPAVAPR